MMDREVGNGNLIPQSEKTPEERRRIAQMGGKASAKRRKEKRSMKELLELAFSTTIKNSSSGEEVSRKEATVRVLVDKCVRGDLKAIDLATKMLGELKDKVEITGKDGEELFKPRRLTKEEAKELMQGMDSEY